MSEIKAETLKRRQIQQCQEQLETAEQEYQQEGKEEGPFSKPGKLRRQLEVLQRKKTRLEAKLAKWEEQLAFRRKHLTESMEAERELRQRLEICAQENMVNSGSHRLAPGCRFWHTRKRCLAD